MRQEKITKKPQLFSVAHDFSILRRHFMLAQVASPRDEFAILAKENT